MDETGKQLERQAHWQKSRKNLSWPEKVRQAEAIRDAMKALRKTKTDVALKPKNPAPTSTQN